MDENELKERKINIKNLKSEMLLQYFHNKF